MEDSNPNQPPSSAENRSASGASLWATQLKILALVLTATAAVFGSMLWKSHSLLVQDKTAFINDAAIKQIAPLKRLVQQRLADEKSALISFAGVRAGQRPGMRGPSGNFDGFDVISLMQAGEGAQWTPAWVEKNPHAREERWPAGHELTLLRSLPYSRVRDGETTWIRLSDRQGSPVYAFMMSVEIHSPASPRTEVTAPAASLPDSAETFLASQNLNTKAVLVGFSTANPLAEVTEDFIGSTSTVYLVDDRGYVASHVNKAYQGALFTEDPLVREITRGSKTGSTGKFEDLESRSVLGHYEKIDRTNLFAVITTPEQILTSTLASQRRSLLQTGLGALLLALALSFLLARFIAKTAAQRVEVITVAADPVPAPRSEVFAEPQIEIREVPAKAGRVLTDGLIQALTEPLHGILGHASLVRAKAVDADLEGHADSIAREARRMRDVVERIHEWEDELYSEAETVREKVDVNAVLASALKKREGEIGAEGIFVAREMRPVPVIRGSSSRLEAAFDRLIDNAIEALQARSGKRLRFNTDFKEDQVVVEITDTGIGMTRDVQSEAFQPFRRGFETPGHLGLGLASVAATVESFGGIQVLDSTPGEGSRFTLRFPVTALDQAAFNEKELQSATETVSPKDVIEDATEDLFFARPFSAPIHQIEILEESEKAERAEESVRAPGPLMLDELDDDDEIFANVSLGKATSRLTKVGQLAESQTESRSDVKIRRPRLVEKDLE